MSPGQQNVIDQGNVHRSEYQLQEGQIVPVQTLVARWGNHIPTYNQFEADTSVFLTFRASDSALTQIDNLLRRFHAEDDNDIKAVFASHLLLACNFWLRKVNVAPANSLPLDFTQRGALNRTDKLGGAGGRRTGILALAFLVENWLNHRGKPHTLSGIVDSMTRENRGVRAGHGYVDVQQWNLRGATRIPHLTSTQHQRGGFHDDPDTRLFSLDTDTQKRLAKLVFRGGRAYRWRDFLADTGFARFHTGPGGAHFVMDKRGRIYAGRFTMGYFWHSSLVGFADALSAGFIWADQGRITKIKNDSGHYHPRVEEMVNMLLRLQLYGVDLSTVRVERMVGTHPKGAAEFTAAQVLAADPGDWPDEWEGLEDFDLFA